MINQVFLFLFLLEGALLQLYCLKYVFFYFIMVLLLRVLVCNMLAPSSGISDFSLTSFDSDRRKSLEKC